MGSTVEPLYNRHFGTKKIGSFSSISVVNCMEPARPVGIVLVMEFFSCILNSESLLREIPNNTCVTLWL